MFGRRALQVRLDFEQLLKFARDAWKRGFPWTRVPEGKSIAEMFHQKYVEIRCQRLSTKLPHRQRDSITMIGGVVDNVLHQVHQVDPRSAKRNHFRQAFIGHSIYDSDCSTSISIPFDCTVFRFANA